MRLTVNSDVVEIPHARLDDIGDIGKIGSQVTSRWVIDDGKFIGPRSFAHVANDYVLNSVCIRPLLVITIHVVSQQYGGNKTDKAKTQAEKIDFRVQFKAQKGL